MGFAKLCLKHRRKESREEGLIFFIFFFPAELIFSRSKHFSLKAIKIQLYVQNYRIFFLVAPSVINYCNGLEIAIIAEPSYVPRLIDHCSL